MVSLIEVDGQLVMAVPVKGIRVAEFTVRGDREPSELHLFIETGEDTPFGFRLKSRRVVDELVAALAKHANDVWGPAPPPPAESA